MLIFKFWTRHYVFSTCSWLVHSTLITEAASKLLSRRNSCVPDWVHQRVPCCYTVVVIPSRFILQPFLVFSSSCIRSKKEIGNSDSGQIVCNSDGFLSTTCSKVTGPNHEGLPVVHSPFFLICINPLGIILSFLLDLTSRGFFILPSISYN